MTQKSDEEGLRDMALSSNIADSSAAEGRGMRNKEGGGRWRETEGAGQDGNLEEGERNKERIPEREGEGRDIKIWGETWRERGRERGREGGREQLTHGGGRNVAAYTWWVATTL